MNKEQEKHSAPIALFKITRKEYIEDIINEGHFYFTQAKYFRKMAHENPDSFIYDIDECSQSRRIESYIKNPTDDEYVPIFNASSNYHLAIDNNQCLFCTYSVQRTIYMDSWDSIKKCYKSIVPSCVISELCNQGDINDYGLLIFEFPYKTIEKINQEFKKQHITGAHGHVVYDDNDYVPETDIHSVEHSIEVCFHKRKRYLNQNEFRIIALNRYHEDLKSIYVGHLDEDEYSRYELIKNKDLLIEIYPCINELIDDKILKVSVSSIKVNWI